MSQNDAMKNKMLESVLKTVEKKFGKGSLMKFNDTHIPENVDVISTGALNLDVALGIGGIPKGRIIEIYGTEGSGKTTLAMHIMANAQKRGEYVVFIDAEHAFDPLYAKNIGLDVDNLYISQPDYGEQALEIVEELCKSGVVGVIVVDSVAALVPKAELDGDVGDSFVGLQARLMSQALRKITGIASKTGTTIIFINQIREKIGVMFGNPEITPGGRALKFYASVRIELRKTESVTDSSGEEKGAIVKAKIVKNKLAPPFRTVTFELRYGKGIVWPASVLDIATELGIVQKTGSWFAYNDIRLGQGRQNVIHFLEKNVDIMQKIEEDVRKKIDDIRKSEMNNTYNDEEDEQELGD